MKNSVLHIFLCIGCLFLSEYSFGQLDSSEQRWFRNYYSKRYLPKVLQKQNANFLPPTGAIPDSETAVKVGILILSTVYGNDAIEKQKPFTAILQDGYWIIYGNLSHSGKVLVGGVAEMVIRKSNGEIINISHGK